MMDTISIGYIRLQETLILNNELERKKVQRMIDEVEQLNTNFISQSSLPRNIGLKQKVRNVF